MKTFCPNCEKDSECIHAAELYECQECGEDFAKYIAPRTNSRADNPDETSTAVNEPSNSDASMTPDVLTTIKTEGNFVICQKCRTIVPPQMTRYQMYYCPNCGRKITEKDGKE